MVKGDNLTKISDTHYHGHGRGWWGGGGGDDKNDRFFFGFFPSLIF